ncbi:hypothetical protein KY284_033813 [Solanum tuberosum]|nr:hypothetical protein KY284_033813 [Solanum tuberosum]
MKNSSENEGRLGILPLNPQFRIFSQPKSCSLYKKINPNPAKFGRQAGWVTRSIPIVLVLNVAPIHASQGCETRLLQDASAGEEIAYGVIWVSRLVRAVLLFGSLLSSGNCCGRVAARCDVC